MTFSNPDFEYALDGMVVAVELPYSEVNMHMRVAGKVMNVEVHPTMAQILSDDGKPFSFPITHGEAGIRLVDESWLAEIVTGFIECGLWWGVEIEGSHDFTRASIADESEIRTDVQSFVIGCLNEWGMRVFNAWGPSQIGHDFWLTRNRYGAGFWDRGNGEAGDLLTKASHPYGECIFYVGDDNRLHYAG